MHPINRLIRWIKTFFKQPQTKSKSLVIKSWQNEHGSLFLLNRNTLGAVKFATYRFNPSSEIVYFILACDRLLKTRRSSLGSRDGYPVKGHPIPSHRLTLTRIKIDAEIQARILWSYPVDFVGTRGLSNRISLKILGWNPETIESLDLEDNTARAIVADLAGLWLAHPWNDIEFESEINKIAAKIVRSNHEILLKVI